MSLPYTTWAWNTSAYATRPNLWRVRSGCAAATAACGTSHLRPVDETARECQAHFQLINADELVRRVRLGDVAWAADDGRGATILEQACLRAVGDGEGLVLAGKLESERHDSGGPVGSVGDTRLTRVIRMSVSEAMRSIWGRRSCYLARHARSLQGLA